MEGNVLQRGTGGTGITGGNILKLHVAGQLLRLFFPVLLVAFQPQNRGQPVAAGHGLGKRDDEVRHLDQFNQNLGHIVIEGNHKALRQDTVLDLDGAHLHQNHHRQIDDHIGHGVHKGRNPSGGELAGGQAIGLLFKAHYLGVLLAEGPKDPDTCQILPGGGGHAVQRGLHPLVHGHRDEHNTKDNEAQHGNHPGEHQRRLKINGKGHNHGAEYHKRRPQQQPQSQVYAVLHLIDVGGHAGHHGGCAQLVNLAVA